MSSTTPKAKPAPEGNPAFNMMGLPKIHTWRLPSRNWCIFWSVLGSFGGAIAYDRYEKKQIIEKYKRQVSYLATQPLQPLEMPRKIKVYMGAPPGDFVLVAREHFNEYMKPIMNAAAVDFELIEGRMQGDIRHQVAQSIRDVRAGKDNLSDLQRASRERLQYASLAGDIVLGRHSYKEYIRGLHEGHLGPVEEPEFISQIMHPHMPGDPITEAPLDEQLSSTGHQSDDTTTIETAPEQSPEEKEAALKAEIAAIKEKIPSSPPSYITPNEYAAASISSKIEPRELIYAPMQHLLGFLNTPWRIYRFLNRRHLAEDMGRATTAAVLASSTRPFDVDIDLAHGHEEQADWPKKSRNKADGVWVEDIVVDKRITDSLRVYEYVEPLVPEGTLTPTD